MDKNNFIWHPFTSLADNQIPLNIVSAEGACIFSDTNRRIIDGISSWWVNIHGHSNNYIAEAIAKQAKTLEHVIFAGFTHPPAENLASRLVKILPGNMCKVFFSDNGSTAVEVGIKLALQYWYNKGINKTKIIALEGAYHGDTFGAMSVGSRTDFTKPFSSSLFGVNFIDFPTEYNEHAVIQQFVDIASKGDIAAFIYEPLLQGASGMRTYSAEILNRLLVVAHEHDIICIADEVLTGFGRTGKTFASENMVLKPDLICISKGLTGGFLPMGITTCNLKIKAAFESSSSEKTFYHGHSYTGNPITCAAANASLDLLLTEECSYNIKRITQLHSQYAAKHNRNPAIKKICHIGTILSLELNLEGASSYFHHQKTYLYNFFLDRNILLRPLGNTIYILPPYVISNEDLTTVYEAIDDLLAELNN